MSKIHVVGIGPGGYEQMTIRAAEVLKSCDTIVGYTVYVDLVKKYFPGKEYISTPMTKETERCRTAFGEAAKGKRVAVVCSGDAGVYGMSGPMLEIGRDYPGVEVETEPGVTAALGGAALLGAPLNHDFAVISLSDLLTPWETIEQRLLAAAGADFNIVLYNPASKKRRDHLRKACDLILRHRSPDTLCGTARCIGRESQQVNLYSLRELRDVQADMFTTVFIGNSRTKEVNGKMVTPRGYRI